MVLKCVLTPKDHFGKFPHFLFFFSRESDSTITNVRPFFSSVCLSVRQKSKPPNSIKSIIPPYHYLHHHQQHHTQHHHTTSHTHHHPHNHAFERLLSFSASLLAAFLFVMAQETTNFNTQFLVDL